jgi:hypothetical protein
MVLSKFGTTKKLLWMTRILAAILVLAATYFLVNAI